MGWTAYYQILRDRPLTDDELVALDDYIVESNRPPWDSEGFGIAVTRAPRADRVLGEGWQKLAMSLDESDDAERLCETLEGLRDVIAGVEIRISDDFGAFGVDGIEICLNARPGPALMKVTREEREHFVAPSTLVGVRHTPVELPSERPADLGAALLQLARMDDAHPQRAALLASLAAAPAAELAAAGLGEHYRELRARHDVWNLVCAALEALDDVTPIVDAFLDVWCNPHGIYWYGDMWLPPKTRDALARVPEVESQMRHDLEEGVRGSDSEIVHRCAGHAAEMLGRAGTRSALTALVVAARRLRGRSMSTDQQYHTSYGIQAGLVLAAVDDAVPTLLLGFEDKLSRHHMDALAVLARLAPERARPILRACAAQGEALWELIPALQIARDVETLRALCAFPIQRDRERAAEALRALGEEPPAVDVEPAPETLVTHPSETVRRNALYAIESTRDPAMMTSVVAVHVLEGAIGRRFGGATGSYGEYFALLPDDLRYAPHKEQLAALRAGRVPGLPEQVLWPSIQPILDGKADELAARFPPATVRLDDATRAQLLEDEAAIIVKLGGKVPPAALAALIAAPAASAPPLVSAPPAPAPVPTPAPAPAPSADADLIDALLVAMAREQIPDDATRMQAQLRADLGTLSRWEREAALRTRLVELGRAHVGNRLLANLAALHEGSGLSDLADLVFPHVANEPGGARRLAEAWESAYALPWQSPSRADDYFRSVASLPELFERGLEEVAAPDGGAQSTRTNGGFELLANAADRRDDATAALVARIRIDRGRSSLVVGWRNDAYRALRRCGGARAVPTAALELAELATATRASTLIEILARTPRGLELLAQTIDLPELAYETVRELFRAQPENDGLRSGYLEHPYWRVRLAAAESNPDWARSKIETFAVWAAIDAAGILVPEHARAYARPSDAPETATWDDLARAHGSPITLPALPPPRDGLAHGCTDYRTWALWAVDERLDPEDAVARVFADELDAALVTYGHPRHNAVWARWRERIPGLPADRRGRLAWAAAQRDAALPASLAAVRDRGASVVAADLPRPHLSLSPELRAELEALERPLAERGLQLFTLR